MYLELAEQYPAYLQEDPSMYLAENGAEDSPYLWVEQMQAYVHEKNFDDLNPIEWEQVMAEIERTQPPGMSFLFFGKKARERRRKRREARNQRKIDKIAARGEARKTARQGGKGAISNIFGSLGKAAGQILGGGGGQVSTAMPMQYQPPPGGGQVATENGEPSWWDKNKKWALPTAIGVGVLTIGGVVIATKKK